MANFSPVAEPGFLGSVTLFSANNPVRAKSSTLQAKQTITMPDVVDGHVDRTVYQLGAVEVGGGITMPVIAGPDFLNLIFQFAISRDGTTGQLVNSGPITLNYSYKSGRTFNDCLVDKLNIKATAGGGVDATMDVFGTNIQDGVTRPNTAFVPEPGRVVTWDEVSVTGDNLTTCLIKEFSADIMNNLQRNYTFCPAAGLFAANISTGKRFVNGNIMFQGFAPTDVPRAEQNSSNCTSSDTILFTIGANGAGASCATFSVTFNNVIYEYQNIDIQSGANAIITSTVNWYAFAGGGACAVTVSGINDGACQ